MKIFKAASALFCIATTAMILAPAVNAQMTGDWNKKTKVTFSAPVEIPGVHVKGFATLPAGTYVFKLLGSQVNRHIVEIQSEDESKTYATIMAIPNVRLKRTDETVITFRERPNGEPPALRAWFYPGAAWGDEFVYGKSKAKDLAAANKTAVLYSDDSNSKEVADSSQLPTEPAMAEMNKAPVSAYSDKGDEIELSQAVTAPEPTAVPATNDQPPVVAQNNTPPPSAVTPPPPAQTTTAPAPSTPAELPHTAGNSGLFLLGGLLALLGALSLRAIRV